RIFNVRRPYSKFFGTGRGAGRGQVHNPYGIARSPAGITYVADLNNGRVNMYGRNGSSRGSFGTFGEGDGEFLAPYGVAVGPDGSVYVSDRELSRIQRFDARGRLLSIIGGPGDGPGQFLSPMGLATDRVGNLYVSDLSNYRIEKLTADGRFIEQFGDESHLESPTYLAVDKGCTVYVADYRRVVKYASASGC
ncbi:MAG: hypothetical protein QOD76_1574, partial [Solirubrobacteraceae bacterium]|nr:hypothetical protein [Solirubrobacteraceae bacterium]